MFDSVIRFFTCGISGDECAIILRNGEEICVTANEAWDIEAQSQARQDAYELRCERGW
jgi:hypothetical protein